MEKIANAVAGVAASATATVQDGSQNQPTDNLARSTAEGKPRKRKPVTKVEVLDTEPPRVIQFTGRDAWCFHQLYAAGVTGCTTLSQPAPRWSAYVFNLRERGLVIDTLYEAHGGEYSGVHGRYVLRSPVRVITDSAIGGAA